MSRKLYLSELTAHVVESAHLLLTGINVLSAVVIMVPLLVVLVVFQVLALGGSLMFSLAQATIQGLDRALLFMLSKTLSFGPRQKD